PAALRTMWSEALHTTATTAEVVSFESLSRGARAPEVRNGLVIIDEAHHARNPAAKRYDALAQLTWGNDVLLLSATPLHNRTRDLQTLCALFLGESAAGVPAEVLSQILCRRLDAVPREQLPRLLPPQWIDVDHGDDEVLASLLALPPPVPPKDGVVVGALGTIVLVRQWCSSDAALLAALERRLTSGAAMESRLEQGGILTRRELLEWIVDVGVVQLALPLGRVEAGEVAPDLLAQLRSHLEAVRALRDRIRRSPIPDARRLTRLASVIGSHLPARTVMFTHSVDTARACYQALAPRFRCALLAGGLTRIASGRVSRDEIIRRFAAGDARREASDRDAMRVDVLIATDVLSEGVDLHDAGVLIHLDLPWTVARIEQRVGRLRRLGATHAELTQYFVRPPIAPERSIGVLRRLSIKAGITRRQIGVDPLGMVFPSRLGISRERAIPEAGAESAARLRRVTARWKPSHACEAARTDGCDVSAVRATGKAFAFVALIEREGEQRTVAGVEGTVAATAASVADVCGMCSASEVAVPEPQLRLALSQLEAWCEAERARGHVIGSLTGDTHRRVLRRLAALRRGLGRRTHRLLLQELELLRSILSRSVGAGPERHMQRWLATHARARLTPGDIQALRQELESRARSAQTVPSQDQLRAVLLVVPRR
ncbi:MAG: DEAD/DEAH box helicase, partial [Gemmatimonadaceae bacterium]